MTSYDLMHKFEISKQYPSQSENENFEWLKAFCIPPTPTCKKSYGHRGIHKSGWNFSSDQPRFLPYHSPSEAQFTCSDMLFYLTAKGQISR